MTGGMWYASATAPLNFYTLHFTFYILLGCVICQPILHHWISTFYILHFTGGMWYASRYCTTEFLHFAFYFFTFYISYFTFYVLLGVPLVMCQPSQCIFTTFTKLFWTAIKALRLHYGQAWAIWLRNGAYQDYRWHYLKYTRYSKHTNYTLYTNYIKPPRLPVAPTLNQTFWLAAITIIIITFITFKTICIATFTTTKMNFNSLHILVPMNILAISFHAKKEISELFIASLNFKPLIKEYECQR